MGDQEKTEGSGDMADAVVMAIRTADPPIYSEPVAVAAQAVKGMNGPGLGCIRLPNRFTVNQEALDTNFRVALNHPTKMAADLGGNPYPTAQPGEARAINTGPGHVRFTMRTETKGWNFTPDEGLGRLVRARDDFSITAASDERLWPKQILDFEHREAVWKGALSVPLDTLYGNPDAGRPWPPPAAEIKVTAEMRSAGAALYDAAREDFERSYLDAIYLHAVAPVPLVTEAEDRIATLTEERDNARAARNHALELAIAECDKYNMACRQLAAKDARIAALDSELAKRPAAAALSWAPAKEVRPHNSSPSGSLHLVANVDGRFSVWTWFPAEGHGGRWLWIDPTTPLDDHVNGYSGLDGFGTGPQDAWFEGWRYCRPATPAAFVDPDPPKVEHNPFRAFPRDMRRMGP